MHIPQTHLGQTVIIRERDLRREYDNLSITQKVTAIGSSLLKEMGYGLHLLINRCIFSPFYFHRCDKEIQWKTVSEGLYVLIHGLKGHPSIWNSHLRELAKRPKVDIFVPYVPHAGNCTLEEAGKPILKQVLDYLKHHPQHPICLIGFSNGSRIATWLETQLRQVARGTAVKISTIAGVHFGSPLINRFERYQVARFIFHSAIRKELTFGSQKAQELLKNVLAKLPPDTERSYDFFATTEDLVVPSLGSSLPRLGLGEKHYVVQGFGHMSIVSRISVQQIRLCHDWMEKQQRILRSRL